MGSGSTGVAAKLEGRRFWGCERDESWFSAASKRIDDTVVQPTLDGEPGALSDMSRFD